ncbi:MAG TPA: FtsX-like permease family protein [Candidatus Sulfotelmatobacter sp.]|nr:FtsX-like permease family protein [Candidatus Sulfotelmatobacter sp.]
MSALPLLRALVLGPWRADRLRSLVTLVAVALAVAIGLAIDLADATAIASFASSVDVVSNHVTLQVLGIGSGFDERALLRVQAVPGVELAAPAIEDTLTVGVRRGDPFGGEVLRVLGVDLLRPLPGVAPPPQATPGSPGATAVDPWVLVNGHGALVSAALAARHRWRVGQTIHALAADRAVVLRLAGIVPSGSVRIDSSVVFVDVATAQEVFGKIGLLDRIDCVVAPARLAAVQRALEAVVPAGARVVRPATRTREIERMLQSFRLNLEALAWIALLVGMYLVYNAVAISVVQRRAEIGTVRALGASRAAVFRTFVAEGALLGGAGSLAGLALGAALATLAVGAVSRTVDSLYVASHADRVLFTPGPFVLAFALGVLASVVAAAVPALDGAATPPAIAMRARGFERPRRGIARRATLVALGCFGLAAACARVPALDGVPVFGYAAGLLLIAGGSLLAPAGVLLLARAGRALSARRPIVALAAANVGGAPLRVAVAVASLAIAIAMMVAVGVLVASFRTTVVAWANETLRADLFVRPLALGDASTDARFSAGVVRAIARVPGVASVSTFRAVTIPYGGRLTTLGATDLAQLGRSGPQLRLLGGARAAQLARAVPGTRDVLISEPFASKFGVGTGDRIALPTPSGVTSFTVAAVYNDYSSDGGVVLLDRRTFVRLFHDDAVNSIAIDASPGVDLDHLRTAVYRAVAPHRVLVETNRELRALVVQVFDRTFAITYALDVIAIAIAVLGVVSTLFALVLERRREFGILRYLGLSTGGVRATVLTEAAGVGLLGAGLGVGLGFVLSLLLIFVINRQAFGWLIELHVPWAFLGETVLLVLAAAVLAGLAPARIAARIRTADAVRGE